MKLHADLEAEEALLGTVALAGADVLPILHQAGLRPEHFYRYEELWRKVLDTATRGPVDHVILPELAAHAGSVPHFSNYGGYAKKVIAQARWRDIAHAGYALLEAAEHEDPSHVAQAERLLIRPDDSSSVYKRERLQSMMADRLDAERVPGWHIPFFDKLATPGTVWLWGGHTSHGKSVWLDQIARTLHGQGADVWGWLNEMTAEERMCRHVSATTGIPLERVEENDLTPDEKADVLRALVTVPYQMVECPGWTAEEIARDIRMRSPDVALIDILHKIPYETERDLGRISRMLGDAAKLAGCVIMATVHLNRGRIEGAVRPIPTLSDIKGASSFEQDADVIGFVWREDDEATGRPQDNGLISLAKVRQGPLGGVQVWLQGATATFNRHA